MKIYLRLLFLVTLNTLLSAQNWQKAAGLPDTWFYSVVQKGDTLFANTEDSFISASIMEFRGSRLSHSQL